MIYHKFAKFQEGISLLLSILILSAISAITFSLATVVFIEIRASGDFSRTEVALYATQAITEEALFKIKRGLPDCGADPCLSYSSPINEVVLDNPAPLTQAFNTSPVIDSIRQTTTSDYFMVNPADPYGGGGYGSLKITYNQGPTGTLDLSLTEYDPTGVLPPTLIPIAPNPMNPTENSGFIVLDSAKQYTLSILNNASGTASVTIETYSDVGHTVSKGLPYLGQTVIDIVSKYLGLTRKLQVQIPN